jgi:hypothetical protein
MEILRETKKLAQEYRTLTGKPLGITGVAEYEAARILGVELTRHGKPDTMPSNTETARHAVCR